MLFFPLFIEHYRKIHDFFILSVPFCFLAARLERWRSLECRGVQALLFLSYFSDTKPFRNEPSGVVQWCVDAAGAHWQQQPLLLCCSWCPEQSDLLVVQDNAPAGGARLLPVLWLLPEAGTVNGRSQACPWAVYAWPCEQDTPFCLCCPQLSSVCSSAKGRKDDKDRKKIGSQVIYWRGEGNSILALR